MNSMMAFLQDNPAALLTINLTACVTLLALLFPAAARLLRRTGAPLRQSLLLTGLLLLLFAPALILVGNRLPWHPLHLARRETSPRTDTVSSTAAAVPGTLSPTSWHNAEPQIAARPGLPAAQSGGAPVPRRSAFAPPGRILLALLYLLWAVGTVWIAARRIREYILIRRLCTAAPLLQQESSARWNSLLEQALGLAASPELRVSPRVPVPFALGGRTPVILLPPDFTGALSEPQQEAILIHEAAHIRHRHSHIKWLQLVVTALYWWHPLVHRLSLCLSDTLEEVCDNHVLQAQGSGKAFAHSLVYFAERASVAWQLRAGNAILSSRNGLEGRVRRLLAKEGENLMTRMDRFSLILVGVFALTAAIGLMTLQLSAGQKASKPPLKAEQLFPLAEGATWTYVATDSVHNLPTSMRYRVLNPVTLPNGDRCTKLRVQNRSDKYGQSEEYEYWAVRADGLYLYRNARFDGHPEVKPPPPSPIIPMLLLPGVNWDWTEAPTYMTMGKGQPIAPGDDIVHYRGVVEALDEAVTVPAGTYHAVRIHITGDSKLFGHSEAKYWFVKDIGMVKRTTGDAKEPNQLVLQLTAYTPADPKMATAQEALALTERQLSTPPQDLHVLDNSGLLERFHSRFVLVRYPKRQQLFRVADGQCDPFDALDLDDWNRLLDEEGLLKSPADPLSSEMRLGQACALLVAAQRGHSVTPEPNVVETSLYKKSDEGERELGTLLSGVDSDGRRWPLQVRLFFSKDGSHITKIRSEP